MLFINIVEQCGVICGNYFILDECKDANNLETSAHDKEIYGSFMEKIEI